MIDDKIFPLIFYFMKIQILYINAILLLLSYTYKYTDYHYYKYMD